MTTLTAEDFAGQAGTVLDRLKRGPLTPLEALRELGVMRLAAVVHRLRQQGVAIVSHTLEVPKATGGVARVAQYHLGSAA